MAKGVALTIGLNSVDAGHYQGWSGDLTACESDARDMADIAKSKGFKVTTMLTKNATRNAVLQAISSASSSIQAGDIFLLSYSGHGGQLPDLSGEEDDGKDETWCLFDGELVDDEIYIALGRFAHGVRVLVFSDSCHSGSVLKLAHYISSSSPVAASRLGYGVGTEPVRYRAMPDPIAQRTYQANKKFYDSILLNPKSNDARISVTASALLISGCRDNQLSADGPFNGLFTATLKRVWNGGKFKGNYRQFHKAIESSMPPDQTPNYFLVGTPNAPFELQPVFSITP